MEERLKSNMLCLNMAEVDQWKWYLDNGDEHMVESALSDLLNKVLSDLGLDIKLKVTLICK